MYKKKLFFLPLIIYAVACSKANLYVLKKTKTNIELSNDEDYYKEDAERSKQKFLFSQYQHTAMISDNMGAITLISREQENSNFDHSALIFEYHDSNIKEIKLYMIDYSGENGCCGGTKLRPKVSNREITLKKAYRKREEIFNEHGQSTYEVIHTKYERFCTWKLPVQNLKKALKKAHDDKNKANNNQWTKPKNWYFKDSCNKYICDILKEAEINGMYFGMWSSTVTNLKILAKDHAKPKPDKFKYNKYPYEA